MKKKSAPMTAPAPAEDDTRPPYVEPTPAAEDNEDPVPISPQEFRDRFEKCFQMRGLAISKATDEWLAECRENDFSPVDAFNLTQA